MRFAAALALLVGTVSVAFAQAQPPTNQIIVKWRDGSAATAAVAGTRAQKLGNSAGMRLQRKHHIGSETEVLQLDRALDATEMNALLQRIAADPNVEYAVADGHRWPHAIPSDPLYLDQWYFQTLQPSATRAEQAWDQTVGSATTVVAVLDTGVRFEHPDLRRVAQGGKLLDGFDFVSQAPFANDGDGRDNNPADPGDFVTASETTTPPFNVPACSFSDSSWHGTRVSSLIGAVTNNAEGLAGTGWNTRILPVRVLGKCGGTDSDIIAAMRWAAGIQVAGVPANPNPAQIINLSLGGSGACSLAYQQAIDEVTARGVLVVASVGNEGGSVSAPANCNGVLGVTGLRHAGTKVGFSSLGPGAGIGAPGGNCVDTTGATCQFPIVAAKNAGFTTPGLDTYTTPTDRDSRGVPAPNVGTSFSAPLVAGAAALLHSLNPQLSPSQYIALLRDSATPFPTTAGPNIPVCHIPAGDLQTLECICTTQTCGAGMLNTHAAVLAAQRPFALATAPATFTAGTATSIDGRASFGSNSRTITSYQWAAIAVTGATPTFADAAQPQTTVNATGASTFTLRLTVTDDQGTQDTADVAMLAVAPPPPAPPTTQPSGGGGGGGGGGNPGWLTLLLLSLISISRRGRSGTR